MFKSILFLIALLFLTGVTSFNSKTNKIEIDIKQFKSSISSTYNFVKSHVGIKETVSEKENTNLTKEELILKAVLEHSYTDEQGNVFTSDFKESDIKGMSELLDKEYNSESFEVQELKKMLENKEENKDYTPEQRKRDRELGRLLNNTFKDKEKYDDEYFRQNDEDINNLLNNNNLNKDLKYNEKKTW